MLEEISIDHSSSITQNQTAQQKTRGNGDWSGDVCANQKRDHCGRWEKDWGWQVIRGCRRLGSRTGPARGHKARWTAAALVLTLGLPGAARADDEIDACALTPLSDVAPLVVQESGYEVRARSEHPAPGESICRWEAFQNGLTADAPPEYRLIATLYHFADAQRAMTTFNKTWQGMIAPGLVRTSDPADQMAREDGSGIAARHGANVVTLDPSRQQYVLQRQPDRFYRLESLALRMAGANVQGVVDPRAIQNPCAWLPAQHALGILTTDPSSLQLFADGLRCTMDVKDGMPNTDHWTQNHGEVQIERHDMGTNAAALKFQHQQTPFFPASTLVRTADATDRLVWDSKHPENAWAVHGPFYVEFRLTDVTPAARAAPGWLYRTQRLALEAAGATIAPAEDLPPDPVVPGPLAARVEQPGTDADLRWTPPAYEGPAGSELYDSVLAVLAFTARNRFLMMVALVFGPVLLAVLLPGQHKPGRRAGLAGVGVALGIVNLIFGTSIAAVLIYHAGVAGSAIVTASHATAVQYNNHDVRGYTVLIRTAEGKVVETGFDDDDFNVYPPHNATIYPAKGDVFTVRYLKHAPQTFVIVADDDSPWAHRLRCDVLRKAVSDATAKADFAPASIDYKEAYGRAVTAAKQAGCEVD
jgi:hypothetical protein